MDLCTHSKPERKVRFTLPSSDDDLPVKPSAFKPPAVPQKRLPPLTEAIQREPRVDERKVHGTARYINGTLNFAPNDYKTIPKPATAAEPKTDDHHRFIKPKLLTSCLSKKKHTSDTIVMRDSMIRSPTMDTFDTQPNNIVINISNSNRNNNNNINNIDNKKVSDANKVNNQKDKPLPTLQTLTQVLKRKRRDALTKKPKPVKRVPQRRFIFFSPSLFMSRKSSSVMCCAAGRRKRKITDRVPNTLNVPAFQRMQNLRYQLYTNHESSKYNAINRHLKQLQMQQNEEMGRGRYDDNQSLLGPRKVKKDAAENGNDDVDDGDSDVSDDDDESQSTTSSDCDESHDKHSTKEKTSQTAHMPTTALKIKYSRDNSLKSFQDFLQRWRRVQIKTLAKAKVNEWKWKYADG